MVRYLLTAHKGKVLAGFVTLAALVGFAVLGLILPARHGTDHAHPSVTPTGGAPGSPASGIVGYNVLSAQERAMLDAAPDVAPATTALLPPIPAADRTQPDLYARAFFTALFTHPWAKVTRHQMLAWVQAQQAASPFITGGTTAQLNRLLVESATDPAWNNSGYAVLPDDAGWAQAVAGRAGVRLAHLICMIPPQWEAAISDGDITDPGLTERLVSADLTMTWTDSGHRKTQQFSFALSLLLEGPPTTGQYGVVVIADTTVTQGASS